MTPLSHGADWDFDLIERYDAAIAGVAAEFALDTYPNQIEITDRAGQYTAESQPFLDDTIWKQFVEERVRQVRAMMK